MSLCHSTDLLCPFSVCWCILKCQKEKNGHLLLRSWDPLPPEGCCFVSCFLPLELKQQQRKLNHKSSNNAKSLTETHKGQEIHLQTLPGCPQLTLLSQRTESRSYSVWSYRPQVLQYVGTIGNTIEEQTLSFILSFLDMVGARQTLKVAEHKAIF